ncbi:MAG TPA: hypothetical protein VFF58_00570 [Candidatus Nitrosotalea sp.]|nr:hypothetical protein [Candidatus Nitrosotalea sp.]
MDAAFARKFLSDYQAMIEDLWLEQQCYRNLLLDRNVVAEDELQEMVERAKRDPENRRIAAETFAASRQALTEFGLADTIQKSLDSKPPAKDKQN